MRSNGLGNLAILFNVFFRLTRFFQKRRYRRWSDYLDEVI